MDVGVAAMVVMAVENGGQHEEYPNFPKGTPLYWMNYSDDTPFLY